MVEGTDLGIVTYLDGVRYTSKGFLIPWKRVEALDLVERIMGNQRFRVKTVAVKVKVDNNWSLPSRISYQPDGTANIVHIDARTAKPGGEELLERLRELQAQYGKK